MVLQIDLIDCLSPQSRWFRFPSPSVRDVCTHKYPPTGSTQNTTALRYSQHGPSCWDLRCNAGMFVTHAGFAADAGPTRLYSSGGVGGGVLKAREPRLLLQHRDEGRPVACTARQPTKIAVRGRLSESPQEERTGASRTRRSLGWLHLRPPTACFSSTF